MTPFTLVRLAAGNATLVATMLYSVSLYGAGGIITPMGISVRNHTITQIANELFPSVGVCRPI